jgi:hypothetical protein
MGIGIECQLETDANNLAITVMIKGRETQSTIWQRKVKKSKLQLKVCIACHLNIIKLRIG